MPGFPNFLIGATLRHDGPPGIFTRAQLRGFKRFANGAALLGIGGLFCAFFLGMFVRGEILMLLGGLFLSLVIFGTQYDVAMRTVIENGTSLPNGCFAYPPIPAHREDLLAELTQIARTL